LTPDEAIARQYAHANVNNSLTTDIIDDAKKVDMDLYKFMYGLYHEGNSIWSDEGYKSIVSGRYEDGFNGVDLNSVADIVNLIPNSKSHEDYEKGRDNGFDDIGNLFSTTTSALSHYTIKDIEALGLGDYRPRVLSVFVSGEGKEIFTSNNISDIKASRADIIVAHDVTNLIGGVPEVIIRDKNLIGSLKILHTDFDI